MTYCNPSLFGFKSMFALEYSDKATIGRSRAAYGITHCEVHHMPSVHTFSATAIDGSTVQLDAFRGKVLLIVNTASACGFTPQYEGLQALHERFHARGFEVLGFPCNQFGAQEPGTESEIAQFCSTRFAVEFPLFAKVEVNGPQAHPLFRFLTHAKRGLFGTEAIKWNFTKFLIDRDGRVVARFAPMTKPEQIARHIERLLDA